MSVKGFKLKNGDIVRYDYESLDNVVVDNTLTVSGAAADSKTVGDSIDGISSSLGNLSNLDTTTKTSLVGAINEIEGELSGIGEIVGSDNESVGVSVASGTSTVVGEITLTPGKWVLIYGAEFNPANATGERRLDVGTSGTSAPNTSRWSARTNGVSSGYNNKFRTMFLNVVEETTYYLWGYQNSGSTLTFYIIFHTNCIKAPSNSEASSEAVSAGTIAQIQADITNLQTSFGAVNSKVGTLSNLTTTDKTSVVNAINEIKENQPLIVKYIEVSATINQGTAASPSSIEIDLSSYAPSGKYLYNALVTIGNYSLPYIGPNVSTYTYVNRITSNKIFIYNGGASWSGTQTIYIIGFFK